MQYLIYMHKKIAEFYDDRRFFLDHNAIASTIQSIENFLTYPITNYNNNVHGAIEACATGIQRNVYTSFFLEGPSYYLSKQFKYELLNKEKLQHLINALENNTSLKKLYLRGEELHEDNLQSLITALKKNPNFEELDIANSSIVGNSDTIGKILSDIKFQLDASGANIYPVHGGPSYVSLSKVIKDAKQNVRLTFQRSEGNACSQALEALDRKKQPANAAKQAEEKPQEEVVSSLNATLSKMSFLSQKKAIHQSAQYTIQQEHKPRRM